MIVHHCIHRLALVDNSNDAREIRGITTLLNRRRLTLLPLIVSSSRSIAPVVTGMYLSSFVMKARKEYDVQYPNLYGEFPFY